MLAKTDPDHQRTPGAGGYDAVRFVAAQDTDRVEAVETLERRPHRFQQVARLFIALVDQVDDDLGIRVRVEPIAFLGQFLAQGFPVLDDAVVYQGDAVRGDMRVGIGLATLAVGGPTRMRDARRAPHGQFVQAVDQHLHLADRAPAHEFRRPVGIGVNDREAGGVVAPVLKPLQTL